MQTDETMVFVQNPAPTILTSQDYRQRVITYCESLKKRYIKNIAEKALAASARGLTEFKITYRTVENKEEYYNFDQDAIYARNYSVMEQIKSEYSGHYDITFDTDSKEINDCEACQNNHTCKIKHKHTACIIFNLISTMEEVD